MCSHIRYNVLIQLTSNRNRKIQNHLLQHKMFARKFHRANEKNKENSSQQNDKAIIYCALYNKHRTRKLANHILSYVVAFYPVINV